MVGPADFFPVTYMGSQINSSWLLSVGIGENKGN